MKRRVAPARRHDAKYDVAIIGAGAAGLSCARHLAQKGLKVLLLEARSRIGGRILTVTGPQRNFPIELGAEFIHGAPKITLEALGEFGMPFFGVGENRFYWNGKKLARDPKRWQKVENVLGKMNAERKVDRSFEDFLKSRKSLDKETKNLLVSFIEGYQGADTRLASEKALAGDSNAEDDDALNGSGDFRTALGYTALMKSFLSEIENHQGTLLLNSNVKKIKWQKGAVNISYLQGARQTPRSVQVRAVVVTVPLGVLKRSTIEIDPLPKKLTDALSGLEMGHAARIVFEFRSRFWEHLKSVPELKSTSLDFFLAGPGFDFPVWWTSMPLRTPFLTAWQGGPNTIKLMAMSEEKRVHAALVTLARLTGCPLQFLKREMKAFYMHDWTHDPFSLGAYSYVRVGGLENSRNLGGPFLETLYFAGEANEKGEARGTVHGAMTSGLRAARKILRRGHS